MWSVNRCLVAPLRRLSRQVDEIAGGDAGATQISSPIAEVDHVGQAVAGMGDSLSRAAQDDERREAERRLLVSSIAHDLRTPLFSLRGYLDAIEAGIGDPAERLSRARAKAEQIDRLVSELFDYARADLRSQPILHIEDIGDAVAETCMSYTAVANEKAVRLEVRTRSGEEAPIDHDDFQRALANVIDNAVRHTPSGGAVTVDCATDGDHVVVTVTDDGHGIPPELLADLFQPVVRPDSRRPSRADGHVNLGLGLTIAARLLANQGGTIDAANARPRGAVFTLRLPRRTGNLAAAATITGSRRQRPGSHAPRQENAVQPREHGPGLRITRGYRSYRADGVLGGGNAAIERVTNSLCPPGDSLDQTHVSEPSE